MQPTVCQFAIPLVFRTLLNWGKESVVGRPVPGGGRGEERREGKKKKPHPGLGLENEDLFLFQMCFRPYGPCFGLDAENLRGDPWPGPSH